jgi:hypothetical protein
VAEYIPAHTSRLSGNFCCIEVVHLVGDPDHIGAHSYCPIFESSPNHSMAMVDVRLVPRMN